MLSNVLSVTRVDKLYIQLLYRCNFRCKHCFHGANLDRNDVMSSSDVGAMLDRFRSEFSTDRVCFLGGEPLIYPELPSVLATAKDLGYRTEVCTNGFKRRAMLEQCKPYIDHLRVSLDGADAAHDHMRREGSYAAALGTLQWARDEGISTGATCTLTALNVGTIPELYMDLQRLNVSELVLHRLRPIGNAVLNQLPDISEDQAKHLLESLPSGPDQNPIVRTDTDILKEAGCGIPQSSARPDRLDRIEISPDGQLYISCKAVGSSANAFRYDFASRSIVSVATDHDELSLRVPQVVYV